MSEATTTTKTIWKFPVEYATRSVLELREGELLRIGRARHERVHDHHDDGDDRYIHQDGSRRAAHRSPSGAGMPAAEFFQSGQRAYIQADAGSVHLLHFAVGDIVGRIKNPLRRKTAAEGQLHLLVQGNVRERRIQQG